MVIMTTHRVYTDMNNQLHSIVVTTTEVVWVILTSPGNSSS